MTRVGIVLSTYNGATFLQAQLDSILAQYRLPDKMWVFDDCSDDRTEQIILDFQKKATFKVIYSKNVKNVGPSLTFLKAANIADTEWVLFCDQDDIWHQNKIKVLEEKITENPEISLWIHDCDLIDSLNEAHGESFFKSIQLPPLEVLNEDPGEYFIERPLALGMSMAIHKKAIQSAGFPPFNILHDEWYMWYVGVHLKMKFIPKKLASYRIHDKQFTKPKSTGTKERILGLLRYRNPIEFYQLRIFQLQKALHSWGCHSYDQKLSEMDVFVKARIQANPASFKSYRELYNVFKKGDYNRFGAGWKSFLKDLGNSFLKRRNNRVQADLSIVLPSFFRHPSGGIKVLYQYASQLALLGFKIQIVIPIEHRNIPEQEAYSRKNSPFKLRLKASYYKVRSLVLRFGLTYRSRKKLNSLFQNYPGLSACVIELPYDYRCIDLKSLSKKTVATWWENVFWLSKTLPPTKELFHLLQGYEYGLGDANLISQVYHSNRTRKFVVSKWLESKLKNEHSMDCSVLLNSLDAKEFFQEKALSERPYVFGYIDRGSDPNKGRALVSESLKKLGWKSEVLVASFTEVSSEALSFDFDLRICRTPKKMREFYNQIDFLLFPSRVEGFGLPIIEAVACGALPIATPVGCIFDIYQGVDSLIADSHSAESYQLLIKKFLELSVVERTDLLKKTQALVNSLTLQGQTTKLIQLLELHESP